MTQPPAELDAFANAAAEYCSWCEGEDLGSDPERTAAVLLASVHGLALLLPRCDPENEEDSPAFSNDGVSRARRNLARFRGHGYRTVFDVNPANTEGPVIGDLGDDLLDTYLDLRRGLRLYQLGRAGEALWHWSFMHRVHWGKHALGALTALHAAAAARED